MHLVNHLNRAANAQAAPLSTLCRSDLGVTRTCPFCRYDFPPRVEACRAVLDLIRSHEDKAILIGIDKLGKGTLML